METELKNQLKDYVLQQLGIDYIPPAPYHPHSNRKLGVFHKHLKPILKKLCENDTDNWDQYLNQVFTSYCITPHFTTGETPFSSSMGQTPIFPNTIC